MSAAPAIKAARCSSAPAPDSRALAAAAPADPGAATACRPWSEAIADLIDRTAASDDPVAAGSAGVGVILPGVVDAGGRHRPVLDQHRLARTAHPRALMARTGRPVAIEHDVRAAGQAELELGAAQGVADVLFVAIGTGIAGATVVSGQRWPAPASWPARSATCRCIPDGARCACGQRRLHRDLCQRRRHLPAATPKPPASRPRPTAGDRPRRAGRAGRDRCVF